MIRTAYIAPTERSPSSLEVKRALLTYDRILLPDPADRDLIPPHSFLFALGLPPIINFQSGPVRRIGKVRGYEERYDELLDELSDARHQGLVEVVSTYDLKVAEIFTIGGLNMGGYPLMPGVMLSAYRGVARNQSLLKLAVNNAHLTPEEIAEISDSAGLGQGDHQINNDPAPPLMTGHFRHEDLRFALTQVARGRLAASAKTIGFCAAKDLVPVFTEPNYSALVEAFTSRAAETIDTIAEFDPHWTRRNRALRMAHDEYIDDNVLSDMTIADVIKLRTTTWGRQAESRDALLTSVAELARQDVSDSEFAKSPSRISCVTSQASDEHHC